MNRPAITLPLALVAGLGLAACSSAHRSLDVIEPRLAAACDAAMALAPLAGELRPWIVGGCGTAEAIAKLARDPGSLEWVRDLIAKARQS